MYLLRLQILHSSHWAITKFNLPVGFFFFFSCLNAISLPPAILVESQLYSPVLLYFHCNHERGKNGDTLQNL